MATKFRNTIFAILVILAGFSLSLSSYSKYLLLFNDDSRVNNIDYSVINPAVSGLIPNPSIVAMFRLPLAGIGESAQQGALALNYPFSFRDGVGFYIANSYIGAEKLLRLNLSYGHVFGKRLFGGLGLGIINSSFDLPPDDPLSQNNSALSPTISVGAVWKPMDKIMVAFSAVDVNSPNLALSNDGSGFPAMLFLGMSYKVSKFVEPNFSVAYRSKVIGDEANPIFDLSLRGKFYYDVVSWCLGVNSSKFYGGLNVKIPGIWQGIGISYSVEIPLESDLRHEGIMAHSFGLKINGPLLRVLNPDFSCDSLAAKKIVLKGSKTEIKAFLSNKGKAGRRNVPVVFRVFEGGSWNLIYPIEVLPSLQPGQSKVLSKAWTPKKKGVDTIQVCINVNERVLPLIKPILKDSKLSNNCRKLAVTVTAPPETVIIKPLYTKLSATQMLVKVEEEPLVPVVFFDFNSDSLDSIAIHVITAYAARLSKNPDAKIIVFGFAESTETDPHNLAKRRAQRVHELFERLGVGEQVKISEEHDYLKPRVSPQIENPDPRVAQENRRVEFKVALDEKPKSINEAVELLRRNPEFVLVFLVPKGRVPFLQADSLRRTLIAENTNLSQRIIIEPVETLKVRSFIIDPDGILYRPRERFPFCEKWTNPQPNQNSIEIETKAGKVHDWKLSIFEIGNKSSATLASGKGSPPEQILWDWTLDGKNLIAPKTKYLLSMTIRTEDGTKTFLSTDTIWLIPREHSETVENMFIVEFVFDESEPLSRYLERRLFNFARLLVARADSGYEQWAQVQGHTDDIGPLRRNMKLSRMRAKREYEILRRYVSYFAGVTENQLDKWLAKHKVSISFEGYGYSHPYRLKDELLGDNSSPYGRNINRRVMLEYRYRK